MFGRPPRTRQERATQPKLTEDQLKIELEQQAQLKRLELRAKEFQDREENLKYLAQQGQDVHQYREKIHNEFQDVLPVQQKAELDRATRIRLREEERLRRQNGLGSAYEPVRQALPVQLEKKLKENLSQKAPDWLDQQQQQSPVYQMQQQHSPVYHAGQSPAYQQHGQSPVYQQHGQQGQVFDYKEYDVQSHRANLQREPEIQIYEKQIDPVRLKQQQYREQLDQQRAQKPISQQSNRSHISTQQQAEDFYSKFGQPQSQTGSRQQQQNPIPDQQQSQKLKYREELDRQVQEKKQREQQSIQVQQQAVYQYPPQQQQQRPTSNTNIQDLDYQNSPLPTPPQSAPTNSRFGSQRRFTSGPGVDDAEKQRQQQQYAEELKRQMEERQLMKKKLEQEEKRREEIEAMKYEQELKLLEQKKKEEQQKKQTETFEHQIANKQLAKKFNKDNEVIKKSALQVLHSPKVQESEFYGHDDRRQQHYPPQGLVQSQQQQNHQYHDHQQHYQEQHHLHTNVSQQQGQRIQINTPDQVNMFQQALFNDPPNQQNQQNMLIHQQYLFYLQQNRKEIEQVKQILEEKLRVQQIEMQNQLIIDQFARKVEDIQKEKKQFEAEIQKLQDYIKGKQKRPLDPQVFASALFLSAIGDNKNHNYQPQDYIRMQYQQQQQQQLQMLHHQHDFQQQYLKNQQEIHAQQISQPVIKAKTKSESIQIQDEDKSKKGNYKPITESMIDNDIELPADSEYVDIEEQLQQLGKSFLPDFQQFKANTQAPKLQSFNLDDNKHTSQSVIQQSELHVPNFEAEINEQDSSEIDEGLEDNEDQEDHEQYEQEYDEQEVLGRQTNYDLNMLKTQEYYAMFRENIQGQSKQMDLKFPAKILQQNTVKLHSEDNSEHDQSEYYEDQMMSSISKSKEVQMSQAQFEVDEHSIVVPEEEEILVRKTQQSNITTQSNKKYSTPKTVDIFSKKSINTSMNQQQPDQSRCTNLNPLGSQTTFIFQPKVELVKSRLEHLFQQSEQQVVILPKVEPSHQVEQSVQIQNHQIENSQWKQQMDMFAYEQSDC